MHHFYGTVRGSSRTEATRCSGKRSGLEVTAASLDGAIRVHLSFNDRTGKNEYVIEQIQWNNGVGIYQWIASGVIGEALAHPARARD